jgi:hypothetical protein
MTHYVTSSSSSSSGGGSCFGGCLSGLLFIGLLCALAFGVTWGGVHYAVSCSTNQGIRISERPVE